VYQRHPTCLRRYVLHGDQRCFCQTMARQPFRAGLGQYDCESINGPVNGAPSVSLSESDALEFLLVRPFLVGISVGSIAHDFSTTLVGNTDTGVRLKLVPKERELNSYYDVQYDHAELILDRRTWLPRAVKIQYLNGAETVHVFHDLTVNGSNRPSQNSIVS